MKASTYTIYNASAGSGKTYTLTRNYLLLLFNSNNINVFKRILAITFTNKAVGEMKTRIINTLRDFSNSESANHPMLLEISSILNLSTEVIKTKSEQILKQILHNYGALEISTIDGFNHKLIRTFAKDLKLPINFEVQLDTDLLIQQAVDAVIAKAGLDDLLSEVLIKFALEKINDDKSWDISYDLNKTAKILTNDTHKTALEHLKDKTLEDFMKLQEHLSGKISHLKHQIVTIGKEALNEIDSTGIAYSNFFGGKNSYLPNYFLKLSNQNFSLNYETKWVQNIEIKPLYSQKIKEDAKIIIDNLQPKLVELFKKSKQEFQNLLLYKALHKKLVPLSVLSVINTEIDYIKSNENKLLISEFNTLISNEIKNQPVPFIYERIGENFKHFFIDEFQDTSTLQWQNLIPLIDNTLAATGGSVMLVGDAKQAIYAWRGGNAEQYINLFTNKNNPFNVAPNVQTLETNYRSFKNIIKFNNSFFSFLSQGYFSNPKHKKLFSEATQKTFNPNEGCVQISFLEAEKKEAINEAYCESVYQSILNFQEQDYPLSSICILVRSGKEGIAVANYLSEKKINITSKETLLITNSDKVVFVNNFLNYLFQPHNQNLAISCLTYLADILKVEDYHQFYTTHFNQNQNKLFENLKILGFEVEKTKLLQLPLYELVESIIRLFNLNTTPDAYLQFYLDEALNFSEKHQTDILGFLDYFEKNKEKLSVILPEYIDAVSIMTIHKSKGLEFDVVIFPFADINIYNQIDPVVWFPTDKETFNGFENLLISYNKEIKTFNEEGAQIYTTQQAQLELENINILYVALTRAVQQLHIISKIDIKDNGEVNTKSFSGMFINYLQNQQLWENDKVNYHIGKLTPYISNNKKKTKHLELDFISTPKETHQLQILTKRGNLWNTPQQSAIERGNLIHTILSKITTAEDIENVFETMQEEGYLDTKNYTTIKNMVLQIINHPQLKNYYTPNYTIYNEREILTSDGALLRPDRLCINTNNQVVLIDYKTGQPTNSHAQQLNTYHQALKQMNYSHIQKLLVYTNEEILVEEVH